jgi:hypothetical protein
MPRIDAYAEHLAGFGGTLQVDGYGAYAVCGTREITFVAVLVNASDQHLACISSWLLIPPVA